MTYCRYCGLPLSYDMGSFLWEAEDYTTCRKAIYHLPETDEDLREAAGIADYYRDKEN